jgi:hypothetical protein
MRTAPRSRAFETPANTSRYRECGLRARRLRHQPVFRSHAVLHRVGAHRSGTNDLRPQELTAMYGADQRTKNGIDGSGETVAIASLVTMHNGDFGSESTENPIGPTEINAVPPAASWAAVTWRTR